MNSAGSTVVASKPMLQVRLMMQRITDMLLQVPDTKP